MLRVTTEQQEVIEKLERIMRQISGKKPGPDVEPLLMEIHSNIEDLEDMRRSADDITASVSHSHQIRE